MKVETCLNSFIDENTYIISQDDTCIVVDPGSDFQKMARYIDDNNLKNVIVYLTHGHVDHIFSVKQFQEKYKSPVYTHIKELDLLSDPHKNMSDDYGNIKITDAIGITDTFDVPGFTLKVHHVPGHTHGHSMLEVEELHSLFTGDFVFRYEIGRCDLPTGSLKEMYQSLDMLKTMDNNLKIYPGHGPTSSVRDEIKNNRYMNR